MADQENNGMGVADTFALAPEDCFFDGLDRNLVASNGVGKVEERAECENLGISSCTVEQEMRNGAEPIAMVSTHVLKVNEEACQSLRVSDCNIEEGIGSISLAGGLQSSELEMRNGAEPIALESSSTVEVGGEVRENLEISGCNSNTEEGVGSISFVSGLGSSVIIGKNDGKSEIKMDEDENENSESESDNPSSPTSASSSSSSDSDDSSTSGGSSDDDDDSEDSEEEEHQEKEKGTEKIEVEVEEGEIKDSDGQELGTDTAFSDDEDAGEVSWSGINDDEEDDTAIEGPIRSKNEVKDLPLVPSVDVTIEPHHQTLPVGVVMSMVGSQVIVEGTEKHDPLNEGSILCITETRTPLGLVDEIFGPVKNPYYIVRFNSENEIPKGVHVGTPISFVQEFANHVLNNKYLYKKGYDASGLNDEELSDEAEFSDDEKEAEYRKMQKMMKRGNSDQNHGRNKNNKKKASRKNGPAASPYPVTSSKHNREKFPPFSGIRPGPFESASIVPPFPPTNPGPNLAPNGLWTNGMPLMQPQTAMLPNGYLPHAQNPYQLPMTGIPFQQQFGPNLGSLPLPGTSLPVVRPNMFAQPMFPQGLVGQNQMTFGMNFPQIQASVSGGGGGGGGEQGFVPYGMQPERNHNFQSGPVNPHYPNQFRPGGSANRGRKSFNQRGRKGWRPAK